MNLFSMRVAPVVGAVGLLLVGCGGGGGGGDSTPATAGFTASNYQTVAAPVAEAVVSVADVASLLGDFTSGELPMEVGQAPTQPDPVALLTRLMAAHAGTDREQAQQSQPISLTCSGGGSITGSVNDADNNNAVSAGDSISIQANSCSEDGSVTTGGLGVSVSQYGNQAGALTLSFNNLRVDDVSVNGTATMNFNVGTQTSVTLRFNNVSFADGASTLHLGFTAAITAPASGPMSLSVSGGLDANGHDYTLSQRLPYTFIDGSLQSGGTLQVQEALGARLWILAGTSRFTYQYFAPGNAGTTPDATTPGMAY
jgi:hypothetical protein